MIPIYYELDVLVGALICCFPGILMQPILSVLPNDFAISKIANCILLL
jgi:hypothetical protein